MTLTLAELFESPDHLLFAFEGDMALFRAMDRDAYRRSIFLDRRINALGDGVLQVPIAVLLDHFDRSGGLVPTLNWVFHVAHCGSTLLARGLDQPGGPLVLREPLALRGLAIEGAQDGGGGWRAKLGLALALLGKRYDRAMPTLVKANVPVNFILGDLLTRQPGAGGILLHFTLADYLAAILRSSEHRTWLGNVTRLVQPALEAEVGPIAGLAEAELGAALWLAQMRIFARALAEAPGMTSLDGEVLLGAPEQAIAAAAALFEQQAARDLGTLTTTYSKRPGEAFGNAERLARRAAVLHDLAPEVAAARRWVERQDVPVRLARPLIGENPDLL